MATAARWSICLSPAIFQTQDASSDYGTGYVQRGSLHLTTEFMSFSLSFRVSSLRHWLFPRCGTTIARRRLKMRELFPIRRFHNRMRLLRGVLLTRHMATLSSKQTGCNFLLSMELLDVLVHDHQDVAFSHSSCSRIKCVRQDLVILDHLNPMAPLLQ